MRRNLIACLAIGASLLAAAASAAPLGFDRPAGPGAGVVVVADPPAAPSGQGGYLGRDAGARMTPTSPGNSDMRSSPTAWCVHSPEPSRCRARSGMEAPMCQNATNYEACRFALDQMHGP